jgi:hypothetical protein
MGTRGQQAMLVLENIFIGIESGTLFDLNIRLREK